ARSLPRADRRAEAADQRAGVLPTGTLGIRQPGFRRRAEAGARQGRVPDRVLACRHLPGDGAGRRRRRSLDDLRRGRGRPRLRARHGRSGAGGAAALGAADAEPPPAAPEPRGGVLMSYETSPAVARAEALEAAPAMLTVLRRLVFTAYEAGDPETDEL